MRHFARPKFGTPRVLHSRTRGPRGEHATNRVALVVLALGVACLGLTSVSAVAATTTTTTLSPAIISAGNAYARHLLDALPVPPQARAVSALPTPIDMADPDVAAADVRVARHYYLLPMSVSVDQYVRAHLPKGAKVYGTGSSYGPNEHVADDMTVTLKCESRHITFCVVTYATTDTKDGEQELRVSVQVNYLPILHVKMPIDGIVTVTGYGKTSFMDTSSEPSSVVLTHNQAIALRAAVAGLKDLGSQGGCMEDALLAKINIVKNGKVVWSASADVCPGGLTISSVKTNVILDSQACSFWHVVDSFFPSGAAKATKTESKSCNSSQF